MCQALLAIAIVAQAHWTHDDSLAREIGAPPGEDDIDVGSLSDELISTSGEPIRQLNGKVLSSATFSTTYRTCVPISDICLPSSPECSTKDLPSDSRNSCYRSSIAYCWRYCPCLPGNTMAMVLLVLCSRRLCLSPCLCSSSA